VTRAFWTRNWGNNCRDLRQPRVAARLNSTVQEKSEEEMKWPDSPELNERQADGAAPAEALAFD